MIETKCCSKCGEIKPLTEFSRNRTKSGGYQNECKACCAAYCREYRQKHKDTLAARKAAYRQEHRRELSEKQQAYYRDHIEERKSYWNLRYQAIKNQYLAQQRRYREEHAEQVAASLAAYRKTEKGKSVRRAMHLNRKTALGKRLTADVVSEVQNEYGGICPYCNRPITDGHIDHIVPISRGGTNDRNNLVWVCASCNLSKYNKSLLESMIDKRAVYAMAEYRIG